LFIFKRGGLKMEKELKNKCPWEIESSQKSKENWQEDWDCLMEYDEEAYFVTKKTYFHNNGDFSFSYKYVVEFMETYPSDTDEESTLFISLLMVPVPESLPQKTIAKIREYYGLSEEDKIYLDMIFENIQCPVLQHNSANFEVKEIWTEDKNVNNFLCNATNSLIFIDSTRGFFLDRYENRLGTTGWDYLKEIFLEDYDAIVETLKRHEEKRKEN
jgi:hypothetical protein